MVLTSLFPDEERRSFPDETRPSLTAASAGLGRGERSRDWGRNLRVIKENVIKENVIKENVTEPQRAI